MFCGWMVWASFVTWRLAHPEVAVLAGIVSVFVCEAMIHRAEVLQDLCPRSCESHPFHRLGRALPDYHCNDLTPALSQLGPQNQSCPQSLGRISDRPRSDSSGD